ncbi:TonB-dependent receptor (plasmid) [Sphingobium sp. SJ10-10]|uniref:TonB-dependent receptor domain-containing protein n=1 Tax=Sphingobium sp. SJ10-10 TaxID=3114999 RepID=UPI002E1724B6|nr:TonB-dependent receptor [Sphingobium sp. SJ10-10]
MVAIIAATVPVASIAQVAPDSEAKQAQVANAGDIVVTGSRIRLPNLKSLEPTVTIGQQYILERNTTNIADTINESPAFRASVAPTAAQNYFGSNVNFVNALGLGSNRTLTLVNGRRFVTSNVPAVANGGSQGAQVDLNVINPLLISSVDVVSIGGAPIYGSDAIAGTVNLILRDRVDDLTVSATTGATQYGDGFRYAISGLGGHSFADGRANITVAFSHDQQDGVLYNDRSFLAANVAAVTNPSAAQASALGRPAGITAANDGRINTAIGFNNSATDGFPGTILIANRTLPFLTSGGVITTANGNPAAARNYQFDSSGNLVPFNRGIAFPGTDASGGDGFRTSDYAQLMGNVKRDIANAFFHFDASDALKLFAETEYYHAESNVLTRQPTFNGSLFSGKGAALVFPSTSPFLTSQAKAQLASLGVRSFAVSRANSNLASLAPSSETNLYRIVLGARGDFEVGDRKFNYEITGNYGHNKIVDSGQDINVQRLVNGVNVTTNASGQIVCNSNVTAANSALPGFAPVADPACVPVNLLGSGVLSQAARDYVIQDVSTTTILTQKVFDANIGGSPFALFGNDVGFNLGYEHREEHASFMPDSFLQQGLGQRAAVKPLSGGYKINELFGEVLLPLVTEDNNIPFIHRFELFGRGRYVHNTVNGGFFAWSAGGTFAPIKDVSFRGNYTRSFRSPSILELYLPTSTSFATVPDLCSPANRNGGPAPAIRAANCAAFLAVFPNATPLDAASTTVSQLSGGNPRLENEVARSYTFGVVVQPRFIRGLSITADYLHINLSSPIASLTVAQIASACFDNADFDTANPANGNAFCSLIRRFPTGSAGTSANGGSIAGQVVNDPSNPGVTSGFVNGNRILFSGMQGSLNYTTELDGIGLPGRFDVSVDALYVRRRLVDITGVAPLRTDGTYGAYAAFGNNEPQGDPKFSGQMVLRYVGKMVGSATTINYVGRQRATRAVSSPDLFQFEHANAYATVNQSIWFDVQSRFRLTFSVTNLFNRIGQKYNDYYIPALLSDPLGRRFAASAQMKF